MSNDGRFDRILNEVWREVKNLRRGVLHKTITILAPDDARDICAAFDIKESAKLNEDIQTLDRIKIFHEVLNVFDLPGFRTNNFFYEGSKQMLGIVIDINSLFVKIIIGIALILIALFVIDRYLKQSNRRSQAPQQRIPIPPKSNAILCLVVPQDRIELEIRDLLIPNRELTKEQTNLLIDNSIYFLACTESDLNSYVQGLNLSPDPLSSAEDGDVYIQILLERGEDTIGQEMKRSLAKNIPDRNAIVQQVYLLADLTNIDRFYRA